MTTNPLALRIQAGEIPPRPTPDDEPIRLAIAAELAEILSDHMDQPADEIIDDVLMVLSAGPDGFQLGKALDELGWSVDAPLVLELDRAEAIQRRHLQAAELEWVQTHALQPPYAVGVRVTWTDPSKDPETGVVVDYNNEYRKDGKSYVRPYPTALWANVVPWEHLEPAPEHSK